MNSLDRQCRPTRPRGFTLLEMLVVIAIIALLVTLLVPTVRHAIGYTYTAICANNLHQLTEMLQLNTEPGSKHSLPFPSEWCSYITDRDAGDLLKCPLDDTDPVVSERPDLSHMYIVQRQGGSTLFSNVQVIIDTGRSVEDHQVRTVESVDGVPAEQGQVYICIGPTGDECAVIRLTYGNVVRFESLPHQITHRCTSDHWLCMDNDEPNWRSEVASTIRGQNRDPSIFVMRFQGVDYFDKWPDYELDCADIASYAMNNAINVDSPRPGQLMLVEYRKAVAKVERKGFGCDALGDDNEDENGNLRTRHFDRANLALAGGGVRLMTREELQAEYDMYTVDQIMGLWAPKGKAGQPP